MTSSDTTPREKFFTSVAGDAFLFASALYALAMAVTGSAMALLGLIGPDGPVGAFGTVLSGAGSLLGLAGIVAGAVIAWKLHGRDFSGGAIAGIAIGIVVSAVLFAAGFFAVVGAATGIGALAGSEFVGLMAALAILVVIALVIVVRLDVDAVRDMDPDRSQHRRLDILRLAATGVLVVFAFGVAVAVYLNPGSEVGEAIPFAIIAGAQAGLVTAVADYWVRREEHRHIDSEAAVSA